MEIRINSRHKGFTLIEMLVVLFICALAILPVVYNWQQQTQRFRLIDTARQVAEFIYNNLMAGIYLNQHRLLSINIHQGNWSLIIVDTATNKEVGRLIGAKFEGIEISQATRTSIDFYGKQGTSQAFSLELQNKNEEITIYVSTVGRIRACSNQEIAGIPKC